jgi:UDP-N-acetylmuramate dehydrogenase
LVEQCGFKGQRFGDAGVHARQALVLVNYGQAKGKEILDLAERIRSEVLRQFDIPLEMEVNVI